MTASEFFCTVKMHVFIGGWASIVLAPGQHEFLCTALFNFFKFFLRTQRFATLAFSETCKCDMHHSNVRDDVIRDCVLPCVRNVGNFQDNPFL